MTAVLLGNYELLEGLGQGSQAQVWRGRHVPSGRTVALKTFSGHGDGFMREVAHLYSLSHQHIIRCEGLLYGEGERYLVLEYAEEGSLRQHLDREGSLAAPEVKRLATHLASALAHAHARRLLHRDLKPDNVLLCPDRTGRTYKLADLGIASAPQFQAEIELTGTPAYMAPEQFYDEATAASDLYSLGVVLFEAATGELPFEALGPTALFVAHQRQAPPLERLEDPFLRRLVGRLLDKRPAHRGTAQELLIELQGCQEPRASQRPRRASAPPAPTKLVQEERRQVPGGQHLVGPAPGWERAVLVADEHGTDLLDLRRGRGGVTRYCALPLESVTREQTASGARLASGRGRVGWLEPRSGAFHPLFTHKRAVSALALGAGGSLLLWADNRNLMACDPEGQPLWTRPCPNYFWPAQILTLADDDYLVSSGPARPHLLGPHDRRIELRAPVLTLGQTPDTGWLAVTLETPEQPPMLVTPAASRELERGIFAAAASPEGLACLTHGALLLYDLQGHERARLELEQPPAQVVGLGGPRWAVFSRHGRHGVVTSYCLQGEA